MQEFANNSRTTGANFFVPPHPYEFQVLENPATPLAHNINLNISHIIEDVKRQRMDIIKLNNELKNSRGLLDRRNFEDMKSRQELTITINSMRKEREQMMSEIKHYKESSERLEGKLAERESVITDLRNKNSDFVRQLNDRQKETDELRYSYMKIKSKLEESQSVSKNSFEQKESLASAETKAQQYFDKFKLETQKTAKLQKDFTNLQESYNALAEELEKSNLKLKQYIDSNSELKRETITLKNDRSSNRNLEELRRDLELFTDLYNDMEQMTVEIHNTIEYEEEEVEGYENEYN
jgi:chromosome segregation ATPase